MENFINTLKEESLPGTWSRGVQLARNPKGIERLGSSESKKELKYKIQTAERMIAFQVTLWPEDEDSFCNCGSKIEPCHHIIAVALAEQAGAIETTTQRSGSTLNYSWIIDQKKNPPELSLKREILSDAGLVKVEPSLMSILGGIQSGRLKFALPPTTPLDLSIDHELTPKPGAFQFSWPKLLKLIKNLPPLPLENSSLASHLEIGSISLKPCIRIQDTPGGFLLNLDEVNFSNSALKLQSGLVLDQGTLSWQEPMRGLGLDKKNAFPDFVPFEKEAWLLEVCIPKLESEYEIMIETKQLPTLVDIEPKIEFKINALKPDLLGITPTLSYGTLPQGQLARRDLRAEAELIKGLRQNFQMGIDQTTHFDPKSAFEFQQKTKTLPTNGNFESLTHFLADTLGELKNISEATYLTHRNEVMQLLELKQNGKLEGAALTLAKQFLPKNNSFHPESHASSTLPPSELKLPLSLWNQLRDYQKEGVAWMNEHALQNSGLILADDMGLGKTLQTLCVIRTPALIIVPTSLLSNWANEITRFRPELSFQIYHGSNRKLLSEKEITVTTYGVLRSETEAFLKETYQTVILDEAHTIRNADTQAAAAAFQLNAPFKIALTGTPVQNKLRDLFSLFQFIAPELFSSETALKKELIAPFILRRTKDQVLTELPPKTYFQHPIELKPEERKYYEAVWASTKAEIASKIEAGQKLNPLTIFEALLRCRQICDHPGLIDMSKRSTHSSKLMRLLELCEELIEAGHSVLVYSQWTQNLDLIQTALREAALPFLRLDGSTKDRGSVVEEFQKSDSAKIFLLSLHAGGVGLNLTRADHVIFCDPWWNPFVELQAEDRAYRMGQEKPVTIHRLIVEKSIEEKLLLIQAEKKKLGEIADGGEAIEITPEKMLGILLH